jgi:hypothetical protein
VIFFKMAANLYISVPQIGQQPVVLCCHRAADSGVEMNIWNRMHQLGNGGSAVEREPTVVVGSY